jgi:hypothetical protein
MAYAVNIGIWVWFTIRESGEMENTFRKGYSLHSPNHRTVRGNSEDQSQIVGAIPAPLALRLENSLSVGWPKRDVYLPPRKTDEPMIKDPCYHNRRVPPARH